MSVLKYTIASSPCSSSSWDAGAVDGYPWLYFGSLRAAENHEQLKKHNVGLVLTVAGRLPVATLPENIEHIRIDIDDHPMANFLEVAEKCRKIINRVHVAAEETKISDGDNNAITEEDKKNTAAATRKAILVHCASGISRSAAAAMVWLMDPNRSTNPLSLEDALAAVQINRPLAKPNQGFIRQLRMLEKNGGVISDTIKEWHEKGFSQQNIMENVANQRREANEIHAKVDQFEVDVQTYLSTIADDEICNATLLQQKKYLEIQVNELRNVMDKKQHENSNNAILLDKPARIIFKSAQNKLKRLVSAFEKSNVEEHKN